MKNLIKLSLCALFTFAIACGGQAPVDDVDPAAGESNPSSEQADEAKVEKTSSALSVCVGPRPICAWPDIAKCICSTPTSCRWRCP